MLRIPRIQPPPKTASSTQYSQPDNQPKYSAPAMPQVNVNRQAVESQRAQQAATVSGGGGCKSCGSRR